MVYIFTFIVNIYTIITDTTQTEFLLVGDTSMKGGVVTKGSKGKECADHQRSVYFQADSFAHKCGFEAAGAVSTAVLFPPTRRGLLVPNRIRII